ncbi:MAG: acyl carrier protein [Pseudonocardiaceae bacterium]
MDNTGPPKGSFGDAIERFVRDVGRVGEDDVEFSRAIELFDNGYLDSLGIVALTAFIEEAFDITLAEEDLFDPRFTTIVGMVEIVTTKRSVSAPDNDDRSPT